MVAEVVSATTSASGSAGGLSAVGSSLVGVGSSLVNVATTLKTFMLLHPVGFAAVGGSVLGIVAYRKVDKMLRKKYASDEAKEAVPDLAQEATPVENG